MVALVVAIFLVGFFGGYTVGRVDGYTRARIAECDARMAECFRKLQRIKDQFHS